MEAHETSLDSQGLNWDLTFFMDAAFSILELKSSICALLSKVLNTEVMEMVCTGLSSVLPFPKNILPASNIAVLNYSQV